MASPDHRAPAKDSGRGDNDDDNNVDEDLSTSTGTSTSSSTNTKNTDTGTDTDNSNNDEEENEMATDDDEPAAIAIGVEEPKEKTAGLLKIRKGSESQAFRLPQNTTGSTMLPKMRIKLSLRLPTKANKGKSGIVRKEPKAEEVQTATVAASDDDEEEAIAELVPSSVNPSVVGSSGAVIASKPAKRKLKPVRVPAMSSPGLMLPPSSGIFQGDVEMKGFLSPAVVFDHCMAMAGYTEEERTENPHRGSSVTRTVGDMFDNDVKLTQHFTELIPDDLIECDLAKNGDSSKGVQEDNETTDKEFPMVNLLVRAVAPTNSIGKHASQTEIYRKRRCPWSFQEMIPLSLTIPYPESYCKDRLNYVRQVEAREAAIVAAQETVLETEKIWERYKEEVARKSVADMPLPPVLPNFIEIPPIPKRPAPPKYADFAIDLGLELDETNHPLYPPKRNPEFVEHLDPNCFHITDGRYFGLLTNQVSDPHFLGPSAPGIMGLTVSAGTSLATSYVGHQSAGSASLASTVYGNSSAPSSVKPPITEETVATIVDPAIDDEAIAVATTNTPKNQKATPKVPFVKKVHGRSPTASSTELKKLMESSGDAAEAMRICIVRAAVFASRTSRHGQSFIGSNGQVYPDVSKAFAAWGGMKPCDRCKNNKQGAYHCRLRRKHKELDHDGGNSPALLAPLFLEPLDDLIKRQEKT